MCASVSSVKFSGRRSARGLRVDSGLNWTVDRQYLRFTMALTSCVGVGVCTEGVWNECSKCTNTVYCHGK